MLIIPAIDLKDGKCVRLYQGDMEKVTVFNDDPAAQARTFAAAGAGRPSGAAAFSMVTTLEGPMKSM